MAYACARINVREIFYPYVMLNVVNSTVKTMKTSMSGVVKKTEKAYLMELRSICTR